jgi:hypothetical protein
VRRKGMRSAVASRARRGVVKCFDYFDLLQTARN